MNVNRLQSCPALIKAPRLALVTPDSKNQLDLLREILTIICESNGDLQLVNPLLKRNLDKFNSNFPDILRDWAAKILSDIPLQEAIFISAAIGDFSNLIRLFPLGDRSANVEISIAGYKIILEVFKSETFPQQWAMTQNNLGIAYHNRIEGNRAENIEKAIAAYNDSLSVYSPPLFPSDWVEKQTHFRHKYIDTIQKSSVENIDRNKQITHNSLSSPEKLLNYHRQINTENLPNTDNPLKLITNHQTINNASLQLWAEIQNNLGNVYKERICGNRAQNIEQAITAYYQALNIYTPETFPKHWAETQKSLANAYIERELGNKEDNIEYAIHTYKQALIIYTIEDFPEERADIQNYLGNAYCQRIRVDSIDNIEYAITAYNEALNICNTCINNQNKLFY